MLSVVEISNRIREPHLVTPGDLSTLQELSDKYPYTQLFSILYLKALSEAGDPRFEEELSRHSYRISDRVQLYYLIENHVPSISTGSITDNSITVAEDDQKVEAATEESSSVAEEIIESIGEIIEEVFEEPSDISTGSMTEGESESESESDEEEKTIEEPKTEETQVSEDSKKIVDDAKDKLDETILHNVYAANYQLEELTEEEQEKLDLSGVSTGSIEESEIESESDTQESTAQITKDTSSSFTGWLHSNNNYTERDTSDKEAINAVVEDFSEFDPSSDLFGEVEKPKTEFFSPTKKAKKSLEENELPVSETLAKIYIMQGNYPQAISAYKQLSLSFPEKKIFFANLIEDLEKKINT